MSSLLPFIVIIVFLYTLLFEAIPGWIKDFIQQREENKEHMREKRKECIWEKTNESEIDKLKKPGETVLDFVGRGSKEQVQVKEMLLNESYSVNRDSNVWKKAICSCKGDKNAARAEYIRLRLLCKRQTTPLINK